MNNEEGNIIEEEEQVQSTGFYDRFIKAIKKQGQNNSWIKNILGQEYETSTTIYKGEINIRFVMDEPFWYSKEQYFDSTFVDANNNSVATLESKDAIKIIMEERII